MSNTRTRLRRGIGSGAVAALAAATVLVTAVPASATADFTATRVSGGDRFATAAAAAQATFPSGSQAAILVNGTNGHFPDALAGNYLAGVLGAPVLLTEAGTTPAATLDALSALHVNDVWVIGGTKAVTDPQYSALAAKGYTMHRLAGADRYATDAAVIMQAAATAVGSIGGVKTAVVATGADFPDALAAGPLSYAKKLPLFLVNGTAATLPTWVTDELDNLGIGHVVIAGGSAVVSNGIERQLSGMSIDVDREGGTGRSQTSQLIAEYEIANAGFVGTTFDVASGYPAGGGADALAGGPHAGSLDAPMLITHSNTSAGSVDDFAGAHAATETTASVLGGPVAISDAVVAALTAAARTATTGTYSSETIASVDTTDQTFEAGGGTPTGPFTFDYGAAGSTYHYTAGGSTTSLTLDQFESYLSAGDTVNVDYNSAGPSTFTITVDQPAAPTGVTAVATKASSSSTIDDAVQVAWSSAPNPDVTGYQILRAPVTGGTVGTFEAVATASSTDASYLDTAVTAGDSYQYEVKAIATGNPDSDASAPTGTVTLPTPPAPPGTAPGQPTIAVAEVSTDAGSPAVMDKADVWTFVLNERVQTGTADLRVTVTDSDGTTTTISLPPANVDLTATSYNGQAFVAGQVARVPLVNATFSTPSGGDNVEEYPATIQGVSGLTDVDEHLAVNVSGSADQVINVP